MAEMMPWSDAYREYEGLKYEQQKSLTGQLFPNPDRPRAPRKKNMTTTRETVPVSAGGGGEESAERILDPQVFSLRAKYHAGVAKEAKVSVHCDF